METLLDISSDANTSVCFSAYVMGPENEVKLRLMQVEGESWFVISVDTCNKQFCTIWIDVCGWKYAGKMRLVNYPGFRIRSDIDWLWIRIQPLRRNRIWICIQPLRIRIQGNLKNRIQIQNS